MCLHKGVVAGGVRSVRREERLLHSSCTRALVRESRGARLSLPKEKDGANQARSGDEWGRKNKRDFPVKNTVQGNMVVEMS